MDEQNSTTNATYSGKRKCESCDTQSVFGAKGTFEGLRCKRHKLNTDVDVINLLCQSVNCGRHPSFGLLSTKKALHCSEHKLPNEINVTLKKCSECDTTASFGLAGTQPVHCSTHKEKGEINVYESRYCQTCIEIGAEKITRATFGLPNTKKVLRCSKHKEPGDVDISNKKCEVCKKVKPSFAQEGEFAKRCASCKIEGDVDVVNVNNRCEKCKKTQASYGDPNENIMRRCGKCKIPADVFLRVTCEEEGCFVQPIFGLPGTTRGIHCFNHKLPNEVSVKNMCKKCNQTKVSNIAYEGLCLNCFIHYFPERPNPRQHQTKEKAVRTYLQQYLDYTMKFDQRIEDGCSFRRPDIFIDAGSHVVIVEIDELQHSAIDVYTSQCEERRVNEIFTDVNFRPVVFLRFNPDNYNNVRSPWCFHPTENVMYVPSKSQPEWNRRLEHLKERVVFHMNHMPSDAVVNEFLFFDTE